MSTALIMVVIFILGYTLISLEHNIKVDKTATALMLGILLWTVYILGAEPIVLSEHRDTFNEFIASHSALSNATLHEQIVSYVVDSSILEHVGEIAEIILFLMGAMTIVELIDKHGGFNFVTNAIKTRSKRGLLWVISGITFFLSAVLDNLTTSIVMIMVLRKLIDKREDRWIYGSMIILAANSGGAFSPIGDVTTIMLWIKGNITSLNTLMYLFLPSVMSVLVPLILLSFKMKGNVEPVLIKEDEDQSLPAVSLQERIVIFCIGVGGLILVPVFKSLTGLPPFIGILGVLALLWLYTEIIYRQKHDVEESIKFRAAKVIKHIDMPTILFFFGILMAVAALQEVGVLTRLSTFLDEKVHNVYLINGTIGVISSIIDNVPLVAGAIGMYPVIDPATVSTLADPTYMANFVCDGQFWQLLAYCAGVGGSLLIIGSAAGVIVMGLERINFMWYLKKFTLLAFIGYISGIVTYYLQMMILG